MSNVGQLFVLGAPYIPTLKASDSVRRMMTFPGALLKDWMRDHYHDAVIDIGSSGALDYSLARVRQLVGIEPGELHEIVFR
ncbi:hypothetical protein [Streptomyces sp. NPDC088360]|uniref:hypothetical protein n=1 Tax=Streptomyces sp. NPDC088360 TaxID=3154515 RepID=UPI00344E50CA